MLKKIKPFQLHIIIIFLSLVQLLYSQNEKYKSGQYKNYKVFNSDSTVNVIIEIPTGTNQKWEVNEETGQLEWEIKNGKRRVVNYLSYPANYGMIPNTILPESEGGDGDPLDIIVLGEAIERGSIIKTKILGVLYLLDNNETDHKIIAIPVDSKIFKINTIDELEDNYTGILDILKLWFTCYKRNNKLKSNGFGSQKRAFEIIHNSIIK